MQSALFGSLDSKVALLDLVAREEDAMRAAMGMLGMQGWFLVVLPEDMVGRIAVVREDVEAWFARPLFQKKEYERKNFMGFNSTERKEGLRYFTGRKQMEDMQHIPSLASVALEVDSILRGICLATCDAFEGGESALMKECPLFSTRESFALLDVVRYNNSKDGDAEKNHLNCEAHFDPGLFSLSFLSTARGLELLGFSEGKEKWIAPPLQHNLGVVWAGKLASTLSGGLIKPGNHRVVKGHVPRLTCWVEVCSYAQIEPLLTSEKEDEEALLAIAVDDTAGPLKSWTLSVVNIMGQTLTYVVDAASAAKAKILAGRALEEETGLAMSKPLYSPPDGEKW